MKAVLGGARRHEALAERGHAATGAMAGIRRRQPGPAVRAPYKPGTDGWPPQVQVPGATSTSTPPPSWAPPTPLGSTPPPVTAAPQPPALGSSPWFGSRAPLPLRARRRKGDLDRALVGALAVAKIAVPLFAEQAGGERGLSDATPTATATPTPDDPQPTPPGPGAHTARSHAQRGDDVPRAGRGVHEHQIPGGSSAVRKPTAATWPAGSRTAGRSASWRPRSRVGDMIGTINSPSARDGRGHALHRRRGACVLHVRAESMRARR